MRTARVVGVSLAGVEAELVTVEARFEPADRQRTELVLSGLPDPIVRESRGRLASALQANGLHLPNGRLFLNLAPAGVRKHGEGLDLPLALGAATACGHLDPRQVPAALFLGALGVDGRLSDVAGGIAAAEAAGRAGLAPVVAPPGTAREAACVPGTRALAAPSLARVVSWVAGGRALEAAAAPDDAGDPERPRAASDALAAIRGQEEAKRALAVAAAGGHGLLLVGPPGTGKSLLARALAGLLPAPGVAERLEITRILSCEGRFPGGLARTRPFRAPHHTTSFAGLVGGGSPPAPGEITRAHGGLLFLDELPEFRREALEALRQPLEEGAIVIARAGRRLELPARFQLVAAMNPCPCGYRGHPRVRCRCSAAERERYLRRVSGPLLDRIDLRLELPPLPAHALAPGSAEGERARALDAEVQAAVQRMLARPPHRANARLAPGELDGVVPLRGPARRLVERAAEAAGLSARAVQSLRRVARTLADLAGVECPDVEHHAEALALRGRALVE